MLEQLALKTKPIRLMSEEKDHPGSAVDLWVDKAAGAKQTVFLDD